MSLTWFPDAADVWGSCVFSLIICPFPSFSLALSLSWHQPSGRAAKWSVSEEGHPLGMVCGTNTAAAFPLLYPSVGFGPLLWTRAQIWPGFSKHACTAARPLYTGLFCNYCQQQLNVGREPGFGTLDRWVKHCKKVIPTIFTNSVYNVPPGSRASDAHPK